MYREEVLLPLRNIAPEPLFLLIFKETGVFLFCKTDRNTPEHLPQDRIIVRLVQKEWLFAKQNPHALEKNAWGFSLRDAL